MLGFLSLGVAATLAMLLAGQNEGSELKQSLSMRPDGPLLGAFSGKRGELSLRVREYQKKYHHDCECNRNLKGKTCVQIKRHFQSFIDDVRRCLKVTKSLGNPRDCQDLYDRGEGGKRVSTIFPDGKNSVTVKCVGNATVFFNRETRDKDDDYNRAFKEYERGFGDKNGDYYLGNGPLYNLTQFSNYTAVINLGFRNGTIGKAVYNTFKVAGPDDFYRLTIGGYSGDAGDELSKLNGLPFITRDVTEKGMINFPIIAFGGGFWWDFNPAKNLAVLTSTLNSTYALPVFFWGPRSSSRLNNATISLLRT